jgi:hypothetical protein
VKTYLEYARRVVRASNDSFPGKLGINPGLFTKHFEEPGTRHAPFPLPGRRRTISAVGLFLLAWLRRRLRGGNGMVNFARSLIGELAGIVGQHESASFP